MKLNLPIWHLLEDKESILIAGAGGGFDVYAGLPLYFALKEAGKHVHLANYSFVDLGLVRHFSKNLTKIIEGLLVGVSGPVGRGFHYLPEPYLAEWFSEVRKEEVPIWMFANTGAKPLTEAYERLTEVLKLDAIILVDGGVDSLMRGDEVGAGTLVEDTLSLIAIKDLDVPLKVQAAIGFGTEVEESVCHYNALENMAGLIAAGGFYGSCALTPQMDAFKLFEEACRYTWEQPDHHQSHISTRIIPAVHGKFGNYHMYEYHRQRGIPILVSPLMSLYWFFDANVVIQQNKLIDQLADTNTKHAAMLQTARIMERGALRPRRNLPY